MAKYYQCRLVLGSDYSARVFLALLVECKVSNFDIQVLSSFTLQTTIKTILGSLISLQRGYLYKFSNHSLSTTCSVLSLKGETL